MESLSPEVVADLKHGRATRERKLAVCSGGAHLGPADRAEVLTVLANDADEMVSQHAQEALLSVAPEAFIEAIKRTEAVPSVFAYASKNLADKPGVGEALVGNKLLCKTRIAPRGSLSPSCSISLPSEFRLCSKISGA